MHINKNNINTIWSSLIIESLETNSVGKFFVSPGSRSAPLATAVASLKNWKSFTVIDERNASYAALGYIRRSGRPACVITTSGKAAANCYTALIEAAHDNLPLVLFLDYQV